MARKHIAFLTGAGVSVESGLPAYRGAEGMYNNKSWRYLASVEGMYHDLPTFLDFYNMRRKQLSEVKPNEAHLLIAELEKEYDVSVITQNVDNLHERAGSTNVLHLHGELTKVCSYKSRLDPNYIKEYPLTTPIKVGDVAGDGSQMRPYVVLFGETALRLEEAQDIVMYADIFVVVGTSLAVSPASSLIMYADKKIPKFVIDIDDIMECDARNYVHIKKPATKGMKVLVKKLKALQES